MGDLKVKASWERLAPPSIVTASIVEKLTLGSVVAPAVQCTSPAPEAWVVLELVRFVDACEDQIVAAAAARAARIVAVDRDGSQPGRHRRIGDVDRIVAGLAVDDQVGLVGEFERFLVVDRNLTGRGAADRRRGAAAVRANRVVDRVAGGRGVDRRRIAGTVSMTGARFSKSTVCVTPPPVITSEPSPLFGPTLYVSLVWAEPPVCINVSVLKPSPPAWLAD